MQAGHILGLSTPLAQFPTFSEVSFAWGDVIQANLSGYAHIFAIELTQTMKTKHFLESADIKAIAAAAEAEAHGGRIVAGRRTDLGEILASRIGVQ